MSFLENFRTLGELLEELTARCAPNELELADEDGVIYRPHLLLPKLTDEEHAAPLVAKRSGGGCESVTVRVGGMDRRLELRWSPLRQGFAHDGISVHYFISPDYWRGPDKPFCSQWVLVSLCRRAFWNNSEPFLETWLDDARMCKICAKKIAESENASLPQPASAEFRFD